MDFRRGGADPTDLDGLRSLLSDADPDARLSPLGMKRVVIGQNALDDVVGCVGEFSGQPVGEPGGNKRIVMVVDSTDISRAGSDLKTLVEERLAGAFGGVERVVIGEGRSHLYADDEAIGEAESAVSGVDCVVVVGSGTITDICKVAISRAGDDSPLVVVQTAASVDGFSDDVSVVLKSGVKRTIPSRWPEVLVADLTTIAEAPDAMTAAGYGDALSMYTAPADWRLASLVGLDDSFHTAPVSMMLVGGPDLISAAEGIGGRDPEAMEDLVRILALRGMASGISGSTAILSGAEHVISHMLDMHAGQTGAKLGVHGAQVAAATVIAAAAWERFLGDFDPSKVDIDSCFPEPEEMESVVRGAFSGLDPEGGIGAECWSDYEKKLTRWHENRDEFEAFLRGWPEHREELRRLVAPSGDLARALKLVGAPVRFDDLDPKVSPETARWAVSNCHFMRNRFNIVDLLYFIGWWDDESVGRLLEGANKAGK